MARGSAPAVQTAKNAKTRLTAKGLPVVQRARPVLRCTSVNEFEKYRQSVDDPLIGHEPEPVARDNGSMVASVAALLEGAALDGPVVGAWTRRRAGARCGFEAALSEAVR